MENTAPIDYSSILKRTFGDESLVKELINLFIEDFYVKFNHLQKAVTEEDFNIIQEIGHSLKGASANLGLTSLQEVSFQLEMAGRERNIKNAQNSLYLLEHKFTELQDFLSKKRNQKQESGNKKISKKGIHSQSSYKVSKTPVRLDILVADDSIDNQLLLKVFSTKMGLKIDIADDGKKAFKLFQKKKYSLIFLDIHMPEMNGIEVIKDIRKNEKEKSLLATPVVALTASTFPEEKKECLSSGFNEYFEKPLKKNSLIKIIKKYLGIRLKFTPSESARFDESIKDLIPHYLENRKDDIKKMNEALKKSDLSKIESLAHKFKGSGVERVLDSRRLARSEN